MHVSFTCHSKQCSYSDLHTHISLYCLVSHHYINTRSAYAVFLFPCSDFWCCLRTYVLNTYVPANFHAAVHSFLKLWLSCYVIMFFIMSSWNYFFPWRGTTAAPGHSACVHEDEHGICMYVCMRMYMACTCMHQDKHGSCTYAQQRRLGYNGTWPAWVWVSGFSMLLHVECAFIKSEHRVSTRARLRDVM